MNKSSYRYYQEEADEAIHTELLTNNKCIIKMFCGTGKSLLMRFCKITENIKLCVYVFPSLSLIEQFHNDYLHNYSNTLQISSETESTTEPHKIKLFLKKKTNKIICVTYQSFKTLLDNLGDNKINVCIFDEAHHAIGETYQKLIFENDLCEKQLFFTATPKNANGIVMHDQFDADKGMCGKLVYDYSYLTGVIEGYLNPFEIRIDMYTDNTNKSVYESIARAILASENGRVLTFHSDVNTERNTSVSNFVNEQLFIDTFMELCQNEFPEKKDYYIKIRMIGLSAKMSGKERRQILDQFDTTSSNEVFIISSCETIGEGIDTKNANMCVFVDPKSSYVKIIQNIGRIVRKLFGINKPSSTILIPCWVDKSKYLDCQEDKEKCDAVIREDMNKDGNFNGILNVLSALKQEDENLYDACLCYPDTYSPLEIKLNLAKQGYTILDPIDEGNLLTTMEYLLEDEIEMDDDFETEEEMISQLAENENICVEIHTNSLENPVEIYNRESENKIRLYKTFDEETEENVYQPIVNKTNGSRQNKDCLKEIKRENKFNLKIHTNPDISVLWKVVGDITQDICSCVIDCDVVDNWYDRLEELKRFMNENERRPNQHITTKIEKQLGQWVCNQLTNYKNKTKGMKETRYDAWTNFMNEYKQYFMTNYEIWNVQFDKLKQFINENKRRPNTNLKNEEGTLGRWLGTQLKNYKIKKNIMKYEINYNIWTLFMNDYKEYFSTYDEQWNEKFNDLKQFMNANKRRPTIVQTDNEIEKQLGIWLGTQLNSYKHKSKVMKSKIKYETWSIFMEEYKEYFSTYDEQWNEKFNDLKQFMNANKRRPTIVQSDNEIEKQLGIWLGTQSYNYKNKKHGMKYSRYTIWTNFMEEYNEYFISYEEKWNIKFNEVKQFIIENKRTPFENSQLITEQNLHNWFNNQLMNYKNKTKGMKDETRYGIWTNFMKEYKEYFMSNDEIWNVKFDKLKQFINENKRRPNQHITTKIEKQLGKWVCNQLTNYKKQTNGMKDETQYGIWTNFMNEYQEYFMLNDEIWNVQFDKLKQFINENKRRPNTNLKNEEGILGRWLSNQLNNYKKQTNGMKDEIQYGIWTNFMNEYQEYFVSNDEIWNDWFNELKQFINENKRRPNTNLKNEEGTLGRWLGTQLKNYKKQTNGMTNEKRYIWTNFMNEYQEYFISLNEQWNDKFNNLKQFINENKRRPNTKIKNEEGILGRWLGTQSQNYKNKKDGMKDETQYNIWTNFMNEYKQLFNGEDGDEELIIIPKKKSMKLATSSENKEVQIKEKRERVKSEMSMLHQKYKTMTSANLRKVFEETPDLWHKYHDISEENEKSFPEEDIPRNRIIKELNEIKVKRAKRVVDMGCGKAQIAQHFKTDPRFDFTNYDHISSNEAVISCDIFNMPLEDDSVEICILSLAMWGSNCRQYVAEANRILESGGKLYIIEATKRWSEKDENHNMIEGQEGNKLKILLEENNFQIIKSSVEKFSLFICAKL